MAAGSFMALEIATKRGEIEAEQVAALSAEKAAFNRQASQAVTVASSSQAGLLPAFSSHEFAAQFHETATSAGMPVDEVSYALESNDNQFYLRYRVTMTVKTRYPEIRKFIAALAAGMPHVSLDNIQCGRESAAALQLSCQLAFSAFFARM